MASTAEPAAILRTSAALVLTYGKKKFTAAFPEFWLYFLGALFIAVTLFLPNGIIGLLRKKREARL